MKSQRIPVLMYHRIGDIQNDSERKYCVSPVNFAAHLHALATKGYKPCTIDEFMQWRRSEIDLPENTLLITFDDGFLGVCEYGLPALSTYGWPAVMFLVSGLLGKNDIWCQGHNPSKASYSLVGEKEVGLLRDNNFALFSHTRTHADLTQLNDAELLNELSGSRQDLEDLLGVPVPYLAYPYGRYNNRVVEMVKKSGYSAAFSVQPGFNRRDVDPYRIRRIDVFGTDGPIQLLRKIKYGSNDGSWRQSIGYYSKRLRHAMGLVKTGE